MPEKLKGIKKCAFHYGVIKPALFEEEKKPAKAIVIIEPEEGFSVVKNLINGIILLTAGCNNAYGYDYCVSPENVIVCNSQGKVLYGDKTEERFSDGTWFSRVKEELTDRKVNPRIINFFSTRVKRATVYFTLAIIILLWSVIKAKRERNT